jgi:hypothetical protein
LGRVTTSADNEVAKNFPEKLADSEGGYCSWQVFNVGETGFFIYFERNVFTSLHCQKKSIPSYKAKNRLYYW